MAILQVTLFNKIKKTIQLHFAVIEFFKFNNYNS